MNFDLSKLFPPQKQSGRQTFERLCSFTVLSLMNVTIKTVSYSNSSDRKIIQACLQNWFKNPKDLHLTSPQMTYPFDFRKWSALYYKGDDTTSLVALDKKWIVAYLSVKVIPENNQGVLFHLIVDREYRRKGLAKLLMEHAGNMLIN